MPTDAKDQLVDLIFENVTFEPASTPFKQMALAIVMNRDN
jgi:hypothetical protein